jgi:hypothetical protein
MLWTWFSDTNSDKLSIRPAVSSIWASFRGIGDKMQLEKQTVPIICTTRRVTLQSSGCTCALKGLSSSRGCS